MTPKIGKDDFEYISQLVKTEAAITLDKGKEYLVESRLEPVAKNFEFPDIAAFISQLRKLKQKNHISAVIESLTTHETSFFRDHEPFEALKTTIIPQLIKNNANKRELRIWCAAASSGQEPYSLCMLIKEHFPELLGWKLSFIASDISNAILRKARSGIYSQVEVNRGLPIQLLVKYFTKEGQNWCIKPEVRDMVQYFEQNLLHPYTKVSSIDLIMMRNVLIYFDIETKRQILAKLKNVLKPDGYIFLGTAETTININDSFDRISLGKTSCYKPKA